MNLYKLISSFRDYETYSDCVVCAPDKESAAKIHPNGQFLAKELKGPFLCHTVSGLQDETGYHGWVSRPIDVGVVYLGVADASIPEGVVCASFQAGW